MRLIFFFICIILIISCHSKHDLFSRDKFVSETLLIHQSEIKGDSVIISLKNNFSYPIFFFSSNLKFDSLLNNNHDSFIKEKSSLQMKFHKETFEKFNFSPINPEISPIEFPEINLPIQKGKAFKILQGYKGKFSHNKLNNFYSLDFQMPIGDTVFSVADGLIVEAISDYAGGGNDDRWRGLDNYIWIYHPKLNLISVYAHLNYKGIFVKVGDEVKANQKIGLSGNTGYSTEPHLHFHLLKLNKEKKWESVPFRFIEGYDGYDLKPEIFVNKY